MPFLNIKESKLTNSIALQLGKARGLLINKVDKISLEIIQKLSSCAPIPEIEINRLLSIKKQLDSSVTKVNSRIQQASTLSSKISTPLQGLNTLIDIILTIPIPQSVPPGIGIPVSVTTNYSDLLLTLKEKKTQIGNIVDGINSLTENELVEVQKISKKLKVLDAAFILSKVDSVITQELPNLVNQTESFQNIGIIDQFGASNICKEKTKILSNINNQDIFTINSYINSTVSKINNSNEISDVIKSKLNSYLVNLPTIEENQTSNNSDYFYKGYKLSILEDVESPTIAKRHFAIATDSRDIVRFKGTPSFSSDTQVLLDEIKFKIDTQLI